MQIKYKKKLQLNIKKNPPIIYLSIKKKINQ